MSCLAFARGPGRGPARVRPGRAALLALCGALLGVPARADVVRYDLGGDLDQRVAQVERLRAAGTPVRIEGTCVSACTLYLGLPNACVAPTAALGFHGPRTRLPGIPLPHDDFERQTRVMASYYPAAIGAWFMAEARMVTESYYVLSGAQAVAMGARACT